jgi:glycerol-3-phosphate acyltransferase PlsY
MNRDNKVTRGIKVRKFLHLLTALFPILYIYVSRKEMLILLFSLTILSYLIDILRLEVKPMGRIFYNIFEKLLWEKERRIFTGASTYLLSAFLSVFLFSESIAIAALIFLSVGDTIAYFVGTKVGKISLTRDKTLEGSLSCLILCLIFSFVIPGLDFRIAIAGALGASLVEMFPFGVDDNLMLPLLSGLIMEIVGYIL